MGNNIVSKKAVSDKFILLGEDDIDDQEILQEVFTSIDPNFKLKFINNGKKLVDYVQELDHGRMPCLIVLDYNMPELNGAEILKVLQHITSIQNVPKIIWSTSGADIYKTTCLALGANDYLIKPSKISGLETIVRHMLSFCS